MLITASALASSVACNSDLLDASLAAVYVTMPASTLPLVQGQSKSIDVAVGWTGSANPRLELSVEGLPSGVTVAFSPMSLSSVGSRNTSLSIKTGLNVPLQTFTITVRARAKGYNDGTARLSATVSAPTNLSLTTHPNASRRQRNYTLPPREDVTSIRMFYGLASPAITGPPVSTALSTSRHANFFPLPRT